MSPSGLTASYTARAGLPLGATAKSAPMSSSRLTQIAPTKAGK